MKKLQAPVTLFAAIEAAPHEGVRLVAFHDRRSIADVVRDAVSMYIAARRAKTLKPPQIGEIASEVIRKGKGRSARARWDAAPP